MLDFQYIFNTKLVKVYFLCKISESVNKIEKNGFEILEKN